jgi:hypothetical protein
MPSVIKPGERVSYSHLFKLIFFSAQLLHKKISPDIGFQPGDKKIVVKGLGYVIVRAD